MFRRKPIVALWLLMMAGTLYAQEGQEPQTEEMTGRQILDEVSERHEAPYEFSIQTIYLTDKKRNTETRQVRHYSRQDEKGEYKALLVFHSPPGVIGVALLVWQHKERDDDQWLYLPAQGDRVQRIAQGSKKSYFMGTDYTYEDLVSESRDKFTFSRLEDEVIDGVDHYVVEAVPSDPGLAKQSGYSKRMLWVRKDNFVIVRTDYYDKKGSLLKRLTVSDLVHVQGALWRAGTYLMKNFSNGHSTETKVQMRRFDESAVPEGYFRKQHLLSGQHIQ